MDRHNKLRARHGVGPLTLDKKIIASAQKWSDYLVQNDKWEHDYKSGYGENLAMTMSYAIDYKKDWDTTAVKRWYDEIKDYNYKTGKSKNSNAIGHFT